MMNFETNPKSLKDDLLNLIHTREMALPDFQRDFVWQPGQTKWLLSSLAKSFPAGSLLRIETSEAIFAPRAVATAPELNGHSPKYLVLDGQQRLTCLYQALYGTGEHLYYISLKKLLAGEDIEDALFYERRQVDERYYSTRYGQAKYQVLPLHELFGGRGFHNWLDEIAVEGDNDNKLPKITSQARIILRELYDKHITPIVDYSFPVVTLPGNTSLEAVCTIFETLNSSGVRLSVFDLLSARYFAKGKNLRQSWEDAQQNTKHLVSFDIDPYYMLQVISSLVSNSIQRGEVLKLNPDKVTDHWEDAVWGMDQALELLFAECGVLKPDLLSYNTILVPLAAMFMLNRHLKGPAQGAFRTKVKRWYWCSVFGQSYESSPTSQTITDLREFQTWLAGGSEPRTVSEFSFDENRLYTTTIRQRAIYRGILCLILRGRPRDFHSTKELTPGVMEENHVDDHHLFPNAYLSQNTDLPSQEIDAIVNRTLIDRETNQRIGKNAPSKYLSDIEAHLEDQLDTVLASHYLPKGRDSSLWNDDYETFRRERAATFYKLILEATSEKQSQS